jgi:succinyl-diaminopimelate desuccinylase
VTAGTVDPGELARLTAELVDIPSESHHEEAIAGFVERRLAGIGEGVLEVRRIRSNVVARTTFGLGQRLVLAGHLDTVPANGNEVARLEHGVLWGLGAADMKGGDAVFIELCRLVCDESRRAGGAPAGLETDLTWVFYACEEVDRRYSGLAEVAEADRTWLDADAAVLGEPTGAVVEAGCQGALRVVAEVRGERAHTARPWTGRNAIHLLAPLIEAVARYEERRPVVDGCEYREALQAVSVSGGVANNVVPDAARLVLNHRFAPDRTAAEAFAAVRELLQRAAGRAGISPDDLEVTLEEEAAAAPPALGHPLLARLVGASGAPPRAKLGWTDVSWFAQHGVPAANFGPGEPTVAHTADERVPVDQLGRAFEVLRSVILPRGDRG